MQIARFSVEIAWERKFWQGGQRREKAQWKILWQVRIKILCCLRQVYSILYDFWSNKLRLQQKQDQQRTTRTTEKQSPQGRSRETQSGTCTAPSSLERQKPTSIAHWERPKCWLNEQIIVNSPQVTTEQQYPLKNLSFTRFVSWSLWYLDSVGFSLCHFHRAKVTQPRCNVACVTLVTNLSQKQLRCLISLIDQRHGRFSRSLTCMRTKMPVSDSLEAIAMRQEAKRFESVCPTIQALYDLLEEIDNVPLKRKMRELVNRIEGKWSFSGG